MLKIVCIGAGRLAQQLMPALQEAGYDLIQVYNRTSEPSRLLSEKLGSVPYTSSYSEIKKDADIYFIMVTDDAIQPVSDQLVNLVHPEALGVHCSGILELDVLPFKRKAGFYPLQSFSPQHDVSWRFIPLIITTPDETIWNTLDEIASSISSSVYRMTEAQKAILHVAAVFANNFSNHMLTLAESICKENQLPFEILKPLILETFSKAILAGPSASQTGPAVRGDQKTIEKHLALLKEDTNLSQLYQMITKSILDSAKP